MIRMNRVRTRILTLITAATPSRLLHTRSTIAMSSKVNGSGHPVFKNPYADTPPLTSDDIAVIKQTVPVLAEHGVTLTTNFYKKVFGKHPELKNIFNEAHQATGMQPRALAASVHAYAVNIENLTPILPAVALIAHKHASLSILPAHYPIVGDNLIETLHELLTSAGFPAATIERICKTWTKAYGQLANLLIKEEEKLYQSAANVPGGWRGWRPFIVTGKEIESPSGIVSFILKPKDGGAIPPYLPGQFTTINQLVSDSNGDQYTQPRQYSLSKSHDGESFRITVKREDGTAIDAPTTIALAAAATTASATGGGCPFHRGKVSTYLHSNLSVGSEVSLAPPFGNFTLDMNATSPVVLIGAGVGLTPFIAMSEAAKKASRHCTLLYACESGRFHPFKAWMKEHAAVGTTMVWYNKPESTDVESKDYDHVGLMDLSKVSKDIVLHPYGDYYVCGPPGFMQTQMSALKNLGIAVDKIHCEAFGTGIVTA